MLYGISALSFASEEDYNDAVHEEAMGYEGDPRRCERHPHIKTSSPDGMFDGLCGECEAGMELTPEEAMVEWVARVGIFTVVRMLDEELEAEAAYQARYYPAFPGFPAGGEGGAGEDIPF